MMTKTRWLDLPRLLLAACLLFAAWLGNSQTVNASKTYHHQIVFSQRIVPTIGDDGTVYFSGQHAFFAINPDGSLKWSFLTGRDVSSGQVVGAEGTLYGVMGGQIVAVSPNPTMIEKSKNLYGFYPPTIGGDGLLYAANYDGFVYAVNPELGFNDGFSPFDTEYTRFSSPVVGADGTLIIGSQNGLLYAINPDGSLKWEFLVSAKRQTRGFESNIRTTSSPVIGTDGMIFLAGGKGNFLKAINPDGSEQWSFQAGGNMSFAPAIDSGGVVYLGGGSKGSHNLFFAVNPDGTERWSIVLDGNICSAPAVSSNGTIFIGSNTTNLNAVNSKGRLKWSYDVGEALVSSPAIGADGTVYILSLVGLHAISPVGKLKWAYTPGDMIPRPNNYWLSENRNENSKRR